MRKRLTQSFLGWQLAIGLTLVIESSAGAQQLDSVTRSQALERADFPIEVVLVGEPPPGISLQTWESAARLAAQAWADVSCSYASLEIIDHVEAPQTLDAGVTAIAFVDSATEPCFAVPDDVGWTLQINCDDWPASTVLLNTAGYDWAEHPAPYEAGTSAVDLRSVLTHELGHVLGLHHDDVSDPLATMAPRYLRDGGLASLAAEDKLALCGLYPVDGSECSVDSDCAGDCVQADDVAVCDEIRVGPGRYCDLADLNCADGATCYLSSPVTFSGYCAPKCTSDGDCVDGMFCDEGLCLFTQIAQTPDGCSTAAASSHTPLVILVLLGAIRRRRCRARLRSP